MLSSSPVTIRGALFRRMRLGSFLETVVRPSHGFRTSLAVWGVQAGGFTDDIAQRVLGHVVGNAVSRSYQRSDFFDAKRAALAAWASLTS